VIATVKELGDALTALATEKGTVLTVRRSTADGFGNTGVAILEISMTEGERVRAWEEGGRGDFRFEVGAEERFGGWWAKSPKKQSDLPGVVLELAAGRYEVVDGRVTVRVNGHIVTLRDQM